MAQFTFTSEKRENLFGEWSRVCTVDGQEYSVFMRKGKFVRIPYKPRGKNHGWHWHGVVYQKDKGQIWTGRVPKSIGVRGILLCAGLIEERV